MYWRMLKKRCGMIDAEIVEVSLENVCLLL